MELEGQVAIVTGAGRGIGRAIALELARLGASVCVAEMNQQSADETAQLIADTGVRALAERVDVTSATDRAVMVDRTLAAFGRIDVLVNNAGIFRWAARPLDISEEQWDEVLTVNSKAVLFCCTAVLPTMLAAGSGAIVNVASMAGKIGSGTSLVYSLSKAAVISMTRSLAVSHARDGIRVNCVCPGFVDTDMFAQIDREVGQGLLGRDPGQYTRERAATIPLGRMETPADVANVVGFLAGPKSSYMTGQAINVTGGLVMY